MNREYNPAERAAFLTYWLYCGASISIEEAAERTGVSIWTARRDFAKLERAIPVYRDNDGRLKLVG